jgi:hypothetical protein
MYGAVIVADPRPTHPAKYPAHTTLNGRRYTFELVHRTSFTVVQPHPTVTAC